MISPVYNLPRYLQVMQPRLCLFILAYEGVSQ